MFSRLCKILSVIFALSACQALGASFSSASDCEKQLTQESPRLTAALEQVVRDQEARAKEAEQGLLSKEGSSVLHRLRNARGYALLAAAMVGNAALTTHLIHSLPPSAQFLSYFLGQVSTLGIYVLGGPIWERLSSPIRRWAFGISHEGPVYRDGDRGLEKIWSATQATYTLNAQISRSVLSHFFLTTQQNFYAARQAMQEPNARHRRRFAVDQIAESAIRMRRLFADIDPEDESVTLAIHAWFTDHLESKEGLYEDVLFRVIELDREAIHGNGAALRHYQRALSAWLK